MPEIKTILGTDGLWWWTTSLTPTAASYKGANNSRNGYDTEAEAREAGEAAEEEASDQVDPGAWRAELEEGERSAFLFLD